MIRASTLRSFLAAAACCALTALAQPTPPASRVDTRSTVRVQARVLLERIRTASHRPGLSEEAQAHLADSADTLDQALTARLQRFGG